MPRIFHSARELIGHTPLLELTRFGQGSGARILAKLEFFNPAGSVKDRVALAMLEDARKKGLLAPGSVIIEPTSGNTGIGLASVAAQWGYRCILVMPDSMSIERRRLLLCYGAEVVLTPGAEGMTGAVRKARQIADSLPGSFLPGQFDNPVNPAAHYRTTGPEIWEDTGGNVDIFVAGVGTGGTVTGTGRFLREKNPGVQLVAVEPADSPLLSGGSPGSHGLQGIGPNFIPDILDERLIDEVFPVTGEQAYAAVRLLGRQEGVLAGISSGAALHASLAVAARPENRGKTLVTLLPDTGERYLSSPAFG